ncbi:RecF/RecN/SMC N terminal domain-domain-containing protein [Naematelia encephala]|uniref:RecF/RecN/SMC N terminal domain-domain-containing protein n=1 Tax=Naematelia encephala TaxID=71784 RepID=A0A1Y2BJM8_9TREE|nr:RecF/RecN/SMC N terminal domain-domain-containing protein [Naematelia encephala]
MSLPSTENVKPSFSIVPRIWKASPRVAITPRSDMTICARSDWTSSWLAFRPYLQSSKRCTRYVDSEEVGSLLMLDQMITMGGNAEIELIDSMDPFSEGVVLSIMPPKKSWRAIANLSGGEKTLASLALVFALHVFKPTPLYFMDEIDAALDFKNVSIVANYIQSKTQAAQFIVISLRNDMFELAHRLVGIYKTSNCTKSIAIDNKDLRTQAVPRPRRPLGSPDKSRQATATPRKAIPMTPAKFAVPSTPGSLTA